MAERRTFTELTSNGLNLRNAREEISIWEVRRISIKSGMRDVKKV